jgi:hypothetical protein
MIKYSRFGSREDKHIHASSEWIECPPGGAKKNFHGKSAGILRGG